MPRRDARAALVTAARALLEERRGGTFTFEELARRAGVSRQTAHAHFPTRGALLVAVADAGRAEVDADALAAPIYGAASAVEALDALVRMHVAFTPAILPAYRALDRARAEDPDVEAAFAQRAVGRRQLVRHVMTRLRAEGTLDERWSVDQASDLANAVLGAELTADLLEVRGWSLDDLRTALDLLLRRALLRAGADTPAPQGAAP